MEIRIEECDSDAYQNFIDSVRDKQTLRKYGRYLDHFLQLIPDKMYEQYLGRKPASKDVRDLAECFVDLANRNPKVTKSIIKSYVRDLKK